MIATYMWCKYCRKNTHNDAECWCTRMVVVPFTNYLPVKRTLLQSQMQAVINNWTQENPKC